MIYEYKWTSYEDLVKWLSPQSLDNILTECHAIEHPDQEVQPESFDSVIGFNSVRVGTEIEPLHRGRAFCVAPIAFATILPRKKQGQVLLATLICKAE